ncbi:MAG: hypothetical protein V1871_01430 [Planctomycetota bacterium]
MQKKLVILAMVLLMLGLAAGYTKLFAADEDAFSVLAQLEKNYVGLEKPGLDTLTAKAVCSIATDVTAMVYYAKDKGLKTKVEGGGPGPNTMIAKSMIGSYVKMSGLGMEKFSVTYKLTKENVTGTCEATTVNGTKVTQVTFVPLKDKTLDFTKLVMMIDTKEWVVKQFKTTANGMESVSDFEYKDGLIAKMISVASGVTSTITNTYTTVDKFVVPAKMEIGMDGKDIPANMKSLSLIYSDVKVNVKIPDEIFAAPKAGDVPKPTENAATLFTQASAAMQKGDMDTAKLKLKQIVTYYPDDPMAKSAEMMLKQLPK